MKKLIYMLLALILLIFSITGCSAVVSLFSAPETTSNTEETVSEPTPSPLPTLGILEPIDAAFCLPPAPDAHEQEYGMLRFYKSGLVLQATLKGQNSCKETFEYIEPYFNEQATDVFSHGTYEYSGEQIRFALAPAGTDEMAGIITGIIDGNEMILQQQGTHKIYTLVYEGGE